MKIKYQECSCISEDHVMRMTWFSDDFDVIYVTTHLTPFGFWKRLWHAIRYVFGRRSRYGDFEEYLWFPENVDELIKNLEEFKKGHAERSKKQTSIREKMRTGKCNEYHTLYY